MIVSTVWYNHVSVLGNGDCGAIKCMYQVVDCLRSVVQSRVRTR